MYAFSTNRNATSIDTLLHIYGGSALNNLFTIALNDNINPPTNLRSFATFVFFQGTTYYIAVDGKSVNGLPAAEGSFQLDIQPRMNYQGADYDADGMTDFSLFRPSNSTWNIFNSSNQQVTTRAWGTAGDIPIVSSFSTFQNDFGVYRPSTGIFYGQTSCCLDYYINWGTSGDIPVPAQYGGGTESNFGVFRPSNGTWYIYYGVNNYVFYQFGLQDDVPVPGQYSADNVADIAVFRPSNGVWYFIKRASGNPVLDSYSAVQFGQTGDKPVPADYDGDGVLDVAVYRPSTGDWWVLRSSDNQAQTFHWGIAEDIPTTGDYDGDGKFDYAVFRPSTGIWYVNRSGDGSIQIKQFGQSGDIPMTSNYGK